MKIMFIYLTLKCLIQKVHIFEKLDGNEISHSCGRNEPANESQTPKLSRNFISVKWLTGILIPKS